MIKVTILSGPHAGKTRVAPANIKPENLLGDIAKHEWEWRVDYSQATEEEQFFWFRQDLSCRIVRALRARRPVRFMGRVFQLSNLTDTDELMRRVGEVEDAIVESGFNVSLERDDDSGVVVSTHGRTQ